MGWTNLPFPARTNGEFRQGLADWLGRVFYEILPSHGFEVREEQIFVTFRMAKAMADGTLLFAEAGSGTGKTFAYLLPAVCYARFRSKPVVVASASPTLQAQLADPKGDIQTLSRILELDIDARLAVDPTDYLCQLKADDLPVDRPMKGWKALHNWAGRTETGRRSEVPGVPDELWERVAWDLSLPCDTCRRRGTCHVTAARRHYRAAADLVVTDHRFFCRDLLTRAERQDLGLLPLLPSYSAVVLDEGHHVPDAWQRSQGFEISPEKLRKTIENLAGYADRPARGRSFAEARWQEHIFLGEVLVRKAQTEVEKFLGQVWSQSEAHCGPAEGRQAVTKDRAALEAAADLARAVEAVQEALVVDEAMLEETEDELVLRTHQGRLDELVAALGLFRSEEALSWVEGGNLWVVPRDTSAFVGPRHIPAAMPVLFSSATLQSEYAAGVLRLPQFDAARVGVPFNLAKQALVCLGEGIGRGVGGGGNRDGDGRGEGDGDKEIEQVLAVIRAMQGRSLVLLNSMKEVRRYREAILGLPASLPWPVLFEGDADRGSMVRRFREDVSSVLFGATFWEGVDVPGESLSCVIIPRLPFPAHDPLIADRRRRATEAGRDPFLDVDLPEMLLKLKQGIGRLIRTVEDRGVVALLDTSYVGIPWERSVEEALPEGAERTGDLRRVARFAEKQGPAERASGDGGRAAGRNPSPRRRTTLRRGRSAAVPANDGPGSHHGK